MREALTLGGMLLSQLRQFSKEKFATMLSRLEGAGTKPADAQAETLNQITKDIRKFESDLDDIQRGLEDGPSQLFPLESVLYEIGQKKKNIARGLLELNPGPVCSVRGNAFLLTLAFRIIVENALAAVQRISGNRPKKVVLSCAVKDGMVRGSVEDSGDGVSELVRSDLFFRPTRRQNGGRRYGAFVAGVIIRWHGGGVRIAKTGPEGTNIEFWLPEGRD